MRVDVIYRHSKEITNNTDTRAGQRSRRKERRDNMILCAAGTELQAMLTACEHVGFSPDAVTHLYNDGSITTGAGRSGRNIVWLLRGTKECAVYVDTNEILTDEQIREELLA